MAVEATGKNRKYFMDQNVLRGACMPSATLISEFSTHKLILERTIQESGVLITDIAICLVECFQRGNKIMLCGNGGSAADAQHIADAIFAMENGLIGDIKKLSNYFPEYRLRVGNWRILFDLSKNKITIYRIVNRKEAYR
jgi:mRNA interferase RelE/StbE